MLNLALNLERVKKRIDRAAIKADRNPDEIKLVVVTKTVDVETIKQIISLGVKDIGENRVQDALKKYKQIEENLQWHMIGYLQKNKVKRAVRMFSLIHSVDSFELAREINKYAGEISKKMPILIQVNTSSEPTKFGITSNEAMKLIEEISQLNHLSIEGLMTMAPFTSDEKILRQCFKDLRILSEEIKQANIENIKMKYLSMGMSCDFEIAIEEGSNMLRIGTIIFDSK